MNTEKFNTLIVYLLAIANYAKDIHYNCTGANFYGNHLFADRLGDKMFEYIDLIKEVCILGHAGIPLHSSEYQMKSVDIIPPGAALDIMRNVIIEALETIEDITDISKGDENLLGAIAQDLQQNLGLLNIMFRGDVNNV